MASTGAADAIARGDRALQNKRFVDAIKFYTHALTHNGDSVDVLCKRAVATVEFALKTKVNSAIHASSRVVKGPDVQTLAELALRDAEKIIVLRPECAAAYLWKGRALCMLEDYLEAVETIQIGLNFNLNNSELLHELQQTQTIISKHEEGAILSDGAASLLASRAMKRPRSVDRRASQTAATAKATAEADRASNTLLEDEFRCPLCCKLLYEPVTTPCGHTFCRGCLMRSLDHANRCPMCRTVLHTSARKYPISVSLQHIVGKHFPKQTAERAAESSEDVDHGPCVLPLFVVDFVLPGQVRFLYLHEVLQWQWPMTCRGLQALALNAFEPRYRLMVRRCLDGDRRFGMLGDAAPLGGRELGCEVEIHDSRQLHDGRYHIQVKVLRRFWIVRKWELDGYRVARVTFFSDTVNPPPVHAGLLVQMGGTVHSLEVADSILDTGGRRQPFTTAVTGKCSENLASAALSEAAVAVGPSTATRGNFANSPQGQYVDGERLRQMSRQLQIMVKEWLVRRTPPLSPTTVLQTLTM